MKKNLSRFLTKGALAVALIFNATALVAQETAVPIVQRFVVIDLNYIFENSNIGKEVLRRIIADEDALKAWNEKVTSELLSEETELAQKRDSLSAAEFAPLANQFANKSDLLRAEYKQKFEFWRKQNAVWRLRFDLEVSNESAKWAVNNGVSMIVRREAVIFANPQIDLSQSVITYLDTRYESQPESFTDLIFAPIEDTATTTNSDGTQTSDAGLSK